MISCAGLNFDLKKLISIPGKKEMLRVFQRAATVCVGLRKSGTATFFQTRAMSNPSATSQLVEIQKDPASKTAVIRMNKLPANSLNLQFMKQLTAAIVEAEKDESIKGLILASNSPKVFCAGLDLLELSRKDLDIGEFWNSLQELWYGCSIFLETSHRLTSEAACAGSRCTAQSLQRSQLCREPPWRAAAFWPSPATTESWRRTPRLVRPRLVHARAACTRAHMRERRPTPATRQE